jgi:hypothetical protein
MKNEPKAASGVLNAHQPAVTGNIGCKDGCEPSFYPVLRHMISHQQLVNCSLWFAVGGVHLGCHYTRAIE